MGLLRKKRIKGCQSKGVIEMVNETCSALFIATKDAKISSEVSVGDVTILCKRDYLSFSVCMCTTKSNVLFMYSIC